jgi:hypothetical protein
MAKRINTADGYLPPKETMESIKAIRKKVAFLSAFLTIKEVSEKLHW